ncbi:MAG: hypothetical protein JWR37_1487, partial [Mycobacterium sp.]|nr:hypothetical protein [Mycobacterium sp.]
HIEERMARQFHSFGDPGGNFHDGDEVLVNAHVIPGACAHVIPQVVGP